MKLVVKLISLLLFLMMFCVKNISAQAQESTRQNSTNNEFKEYFDEQAVPPGGMSGYYKYLAKHTKYPRAAIKANAEGTVQIRIYVDKKGKVVDAQVFKDNVGYGCAEEAARVIKSMHRWKPGKVNGEAVATTFPLPVKFVLH
jgi:TonB family protein